MPMHNRRGQISILTSLIALVVVGLSYQTYNAFKEAVRRRHVVLRYRVMAEAYASELAEYFRGLPAGAVESYLMQNPTTCSVEPKDRYFYCAHINMLNRGSGIVMNADHLADLPTSQFDQQTGTNCGPTDVRRLRGNRWYQVQVVNKTSLAPVPEACLRTFGDYALRPDETLLITVGVNYFNPGEGTCNALTVTNPGGCNPCTVQGDINRNLQRVTASVMLLRDTYCDFAAPGTACTAPPSAPIQLCVPSTVGGA